MVLRFREVQGGRTPVNYSMSRIPFSPGEPGLRRGRIRSSSDPKTSQKQKTEKIIKSLDPDLYSSMNRL